MAACLPSLSDNHFDPIGACFLRGVNRTDLFPDRDVCIAKELDVLRRRMTPMKRHDRHAFFCTDTNSRVIVEDSEKVDVERRCRLLAHAPNRGAKLLRGYEAHSDGANTSAAADRQRQVLGRGEGHAGTGEWISQAETLGEARSDTGHTSTFRIPQQRFSCG
jgi:hypothetical protein